MSEVLRFLGLAEDGAGVGYLLVAALVWLVVRVKALDEGLGEVKSDIKDILKRLPKTP